MLLENIRLGRTLEIFVEREDYRYHFTSKVEDTNQNRVCVTAIASRGRFFGFLPEDKVHILYRDEEVMWEWPGVRPGLAKLEGTPVHYFQIVNPGQSYNRRNAYRVKLLEDMEFGYYQLPGKKDKIAQLPFPSDSSEMSPEELEKWYKTMPDAVMVKGMIKDISENGAGIYTDEKLELEDELFFELPSPYGNLLVKVFIIRKEEVKSVTNRYGFYYGCAIVESDRRLLRYIYDLQREILKRQRAMENAKV